MKVFPNHLLFSFLIKTMTIILFYNMMNIDFMQAGDHMEWDQRFFYEVCQNQCLNSVE